MEEHSDKPLLFDDEAPYPDWKERHTNGTQRKNSGSFLASILVKVIANLVSAVIILVVLTLVCPQLLLSVLQRVSRSEYAYKHFPLHSDIHWMKLSPDPDYWSSSLYVEASPESDIAWNALMRRHGFRAYDEEAERLNLTSSLPLEKGGFSASLGVDHNLHCIRHIKQWHFRDYYYANKSDEDLEWITGHTLHCLETLRLSVMCFPDLNLSPFYMAPEQPHHPTHISASGLKQCVDYDVLNDALNERRYQRAEYGEEVNRMLDVSSQG